jgi:hypothetical protein
MYFFGGIRFELKASTPAKQVFYSLSHTSSPFYCGYFGDGSLSNYLPMLALNHDPPDLSLPSC